MKQPCVMISEVVSARVGLCWCGCTKSVSAGKSFLAGHDKRAEARVIRERYGSVAAFLLSHGEDPFGAPERVYVPNVVMSDSARAVVASIEEPLPVVAVGVFEPDPCARIGAIRPMVSDGHALGGRRLEFELGDVYAGSAAASRDVAATGRYRTALQVLSDAQARGVPVKEQLALIREVAAAEEELGVDERSPAARAAAQRLVDGDDDRYRDALEAAVLDEPRDIEAWVHLGTLAMEAPVDEDGEPVGEGDLQAAHACFETAVGVAELSLPDAFAGTTPHARLGNRPWLDALHGLAVCRSRAGASDAAADIEETLLWLDPSDPYALRSAVLTPF